jgi:ferredoxin/flavodoxin---NADP+ reductase
MPHLTAPSAGSTPVASTHLFDTTIIGGGPVGLFAAFYAGLRQMTCKIIDSLEELGGQLTALYPEKYVYDVAGFPKVFARDLARNLIEQAMEYQPTICLGEVVTTLEILKGHAPAEPPEIQGALAQGLTVYKVTSDHATHYTRTLIISAGAGAFSPKKLLLKDAATTAALENRGIYYACRSKSVFADKRILIAGGGDSALDWAWNLHETTAGGDGSGITLIHRRNQFRAHEESVKRLQRTKVKILTFSEIDAIHHEDGVIKAVELVNNQTKARHTLHVDAILVQFGFSSSLGPIKNWPLKIEKNAIAVNQEMETELSGVFAVGDVSAFKGKLKLIVTGFGEAAIAVNVAKTRIDPHAKMFPGHSSEMSGAETLVTI